MSLKTLSQKVFLSFVVLLLTAAISKAQSPKFLEACIQKNEEHKAMSRIKKRIPTDFNLYMWAGFLKNNCESTIATKSTNLVPKIAQERFVVRALLKLHSICPDPHFDKIMPELNALKAVYDEIKIEKSSDSSDDGGFSGLFDDEQTEDVNVTIKQLKTIKKITTALQKKVK